MYLKSVFASCAALLLAVGINSSWAQGDAEAGREKSGICAACHGLDGNSIVAQWPKLAGQHPDYLVEQMKMIQSGDWAVPEMVGIVQDLTEQDFENLAAYFSAQTVTAESVDPQYTALGRKLYEYGNPETGVPACKACHGATGKGDPVSAYPALAGQHGLYTSNSLKAFRNTERGMNSDAGGIMIGVAKFLTDEEIAAVSAYVGGLKAD